MQLAAALGFVGLVRGDRVKIETLGQRAVGPAPVFRGRRSLWRMLEPPGRHPSRGQSASLAEGVKNFCIRNSGRGIVVLLSDLMDKAGYETALRYLVSRDMDVYVIQILSAEEIDPDIQGDLRLVDCEDGDAAEVTVTGAAVEALQADARGLRRRRPGSIATAAAWSICWRATKCRSTT